MKTTTLDPNETTATKDATVKDPNPIATGARQVADTVAGAAGEMSARLPEVAHGTKSALGDATRLVGRGSDESLRLAGAGALGVALGLLVGGAARILVLIALVPAVVIAVTLFDRSDSRRLVH